MNLAPDPRDDEFRAMVRDWIAANLPADIAQRGHRDYHSSRPHVERWTKILNARGWAAPHWHPAVGGTDWTPAQTHIFHEELRMAGAPVLERSGLELVGPVIAEFGSDDQQARFLPRILNGDDWWCQGFSEPGAGSDLASLRTRADLDGDQYAVNGQKIWTSEAHWADWIFMLVRTDQHAKPQAGISFLLIDMTSPGITRRPIYGIDEGLTLNEVFFDNVRVPAENLVGTPGMGWTYAKFLLTNERTMSAEVPHSKRDLAQLKRLAAMGRKRGKTLSDDPVFAAKIARVEIDLIALDWAVKRVLHAEPGDARLNAVASVLKLRGSELRQRLAELAAEALGDHGIAALPDPDGAHNLKVDGLAPPIVEEGIGVTAKAMFRRATTIYGGTNEIQRSIIAKSILGL